jgi:hypothetical protein
VATAAENRVSFRRNLHKLFGMDCRVTDELIAMAEHDRKVRDELAATGALYEGYDPRMAAVYEKNALRLRETPLSNEGSFTRLAIAHTTNELTSAICGKDA